MVAPSSGSYGPSIRPAAACRSGALLRLLRLSPSRFHAWQRHDTCALDDQSSCPRTSPHRLTQAEVRVIEELVTSPDYRHLPTGTLAVLAQRLDRVWASPSTWYRRVRRFGWRRPRLRVHPAKPKVGLRSTHANEVWHIDTTIVRLVDGTRAYLHAVIRQFLTADSGLARRRHLRASKQRGSLARRRSPSDRRRSRPGVPGRRWRRERQRPDRRPHCIGRPASGTGFRKPGEAWVKRLWGWAVA